MLKFDLEHVRAQTPGLAHSTHLLACGSALMPSPVIEAVINYTELEASLGGYEAQSKRADDLARVYDLVAGHIGAIRDEIALMENATAAWCHAFYALPLPSGSRILTCEAEYAANYVAFLQRAKRDNLSIEVVPSDGTGVLDVDALESMIDSNVGVIAMTWVPTNGGLVNPAERVGAVARKHNVPYLLDACQAVGQMPVDVERLGCDFLSATGRKFLRGPRGTGFLYISSKWLDQIEPVMIDHFGAPWTGREEYTLRNDARRFETWENSYALRAGLAAAVEYADSIGIDVIEKRIGELATRCRDGLSSLNNVSVMDLGTAPCGIVSFDVHGANPRKVVAKMAETGFVIGSSEPSSTRIDAERRGLSTLLRIAPHYYNSEEEIDRAVERLNAILN